MKLIHNEDNIYARARSKFGDTSAKTTMSTYKVNVPSLDTHHPLCYFNKEVGIYLFMLLRLC